MPRGLSCVRLLFCLVFGAYGDFERVEFVFDGFFDGGGDIGGVGSEGFAECFDGCGLCGKCGFKRGDIVACLDY